MDTLLTRHPLSNFFPTMSDEEYEALKADIKEHGQQEPVVIYKGEVLDGWHRYRACCELEIEVRTREWGGECGSAMNYVWSMNVFRRHLNESQRALLAAAMGKFARAQITGESGENPGITLAEASDAMQVSERTVKDAKVVLDQGTEAEVAEVREGKTAVSAVARQIRSGKTPTERAADRKRKEARMKPRKGAEPQPPTFVEETKPTDFGGAALGAAVPAERPTPAVKPSEAQEVAVLNWLQIVLIDFAELPEDPVCVAPMVYASDFRDVIESRIFKVAHWLQEFCEEWQKERAADRRRNAEDGQKLKSRSQRVTKVDLRKVSGDFDVSTTAPTLPL